MPIKKKKTRSPAQMLKYLKKNKKRFVKSRGSAKVSISNNYIKGMLTYKGPKLSVFPPAYRTTLRTLFDGQYPSSSLALTQFQLWGSGMIHPFITTTPALSIAGIALKDITTLSIPPIPLNMQTSVATLCPEGLRQLLSTTTNYGPYNLAHVISSTLKITMIPAVGLDNLYVSTIPQCLTDANLLTFQNEVDNNVNGKQKLLTSSISQSQCTISNTANYPSLLGLTVQDYMASNQTIYGVTGTYQASGIGANPTSQGFIWNVIIQTANGVATTQNMAMRIELIQDVIFHSRNNNLSST